MRAVVLREFGPPENLRWETVPTPEPQAGEVLLRVHAVSVDLFQMEFRSGRALQVELPRIMGYFPRGSVLETPTWVFSEEVEVTGNRSAGRQDVAEAISLIQNGRIKPVVGKVFPLQDAVKAHQAFEAGEIVGRAVLVV